MSHHNHGQSQPSAQPQAEAVPVEAAESKAPKNTAVVTLAKVTQELANQIASNTDDKIRYVYHAAVSTFVQLPLDAQIDAVLAARKSVKQVEANAN